MKSSTAATAFPHLTSVTLHKPVTKYLTRCNIRIEGLIQVHSSGDTVHSEVRGMATGTGPAGTARSHLCGTISRESGMMHSSGLLVSPATFIQSKVQAYGILPGFIVGLLFSVKPIKLSKPTITFDNGEYAL